MNAIEQKRIEIQQLKNAMRNHADYCKDEIRKREREIEILLEREQKQEAKARLKRELSIEAHITRVLARVDYVTAPRPAGAERGAA